MVNKIRHVLKGQKNMTCIVKLCETKKFSLLLCYIHIYAFCSTLVKFVLSSDLLTEEKKKIEKTTINLIC